MKFRKTFIVLSFLLFISIFAFVQASGKNQLVHNKIGNSAGNINNAGFAAKQGDWIYYGGWNGLYKSKADGTSSQKISDNTAVFINVLGDWIYYVNASDDFRIYKVGINGEGEKKLNNEQNCYHMIVSGDWIYYSNNSNADDELKRMKLDGTGKTLLFHTKVPDCFNIAGNSLYYTKYEPKGVYGIFKSDLNGEHEKKISDSISYEMMIVGEQWIYYLKEEGKKSTIYKAKLDGTQITRIVDDDVSAMNMSNGWIYYINDSDKGYLYKVKTDGTGRVRVLKEAISQFSIVGDWIYYTDYLMTPTFYSAEHLNSSQVVNLYRVKTNGSKKEIVVKPDALKVKIKNRTADLDGLLFEGGDADQQDGWIYYMDGDIGLTKVKADGTGKMTIGSKGRSICVSGDWVYYINYNPTLNPTIFKIKLNGTKNTEVCRDKTWAMLVAGDWIYYVNESDNGCLYKIKVNGTVKTKLSNGDCTNLMLYNQMLYYIDIKDNHSLKRVGIDGTMNERLTDNVMSYTLHKGSIYYVANTSPNILKMRSMDGQLNKEMIAELKQSINWMSISDSAVFFIDADSNSNTPGLYRMNLDGTGVKALETGECSEYGAVVIGDWIYYTIQAEVNVGELHKIKRDGTGKTVISNYINGTITTIR